MSLIQKIFSLPFCRCGRNASLPRMRYQEAKHILQNSGSLIDCRYEMLFVERNWKVIAEKLHLIGARCQGFIYRGERALQQVLSFFRTGYVLYEDPDIICKIYLAIIRSYVRFHILPLRS